MCAALFAGLALPAHAAKERAVVIPGTLAVEGARGQLTIDATGTLVGHVERGTLVIIDRTPGDQWSPRVNGVPYGKVVTIRGRDLTFWIPGGSYRVVVKGEGISISARGIGKLTPKLKSDPSGRDIGIIRVGDEDAISLGALDDRLIEFGGPVTDAESDETAPE